jgi:hypothetical protein
MIFRAQDFRPNPKGKYTANSTHLSFLAIGNFIFSTAAAALKKVAAQCGMTRI